MRTAVFDIFQSAYIAEHPVLGMLAYRACIEKNQIRLIRLLREAKTHVCKHAFNMLGV
jgi:hypothetical protein